MAFNLMFLTFLNYGLIKATNFKVGLNATDPITTLQDFLIVTTNGIGGEGHVETGLLVDNSLVSVIIIPFSNLTKATESCFGQSGVTSNLIVLSNASNSSDSLRSALLKVTDEVSRIKIKRKSYCQVFIPFHSCETYGVQSAVMQEFNINFPFKWYSDFYIVQYCGIHTKLKVWEVYSFKDRVFFHVVGEQRRRNVEDDAVFNFTEFSSTVLSKVLRRGDLELTDVVASAYLEEGNENDNLYELELGRDKNGQERLIGGISVSIYHDFRDSMNFREKLLKIYLKEENYFETSFKSDNYTFDVNLYHLGVTKNRTLVAKPLHPTFFDGVHAIFVQPSGQSIRNIYRKPFALQMWYVLMLIWTAIFLVSKLMLFIQAKYCKFSNTVEAAERLPQANYLVELGSCYGNVNELDEETTSDLKTFDATLWCIATICQQGWHDLPSSTSVRIVLCCGLFLSVVCYSAYTGKIVSELWNVPTPIHSLRQLLSFTESLYLLNASDTSSDILEGLSNASPQMLDKIEFYPMEIVYLKLLERPGRTCVITWLDGLTSLLHDKFKNQSSRTSSSRNNNKNSFVDAYFCETFSSFSFQATSSLFVPRDSELELLFNYRIVVGLERGLIRRYWKAFKRATTLSCVQTNPKMTTLDFGHVFFAFFLLFLGMGLSVALFAVEVTLSRIKRGK